MSTHSPAPWTFKVPPPDCGVRFKIFDAQRKDDGSPYAPLCEVREEMDARLIAAAPKMLALLRSLVADIDAMDKGGHMFGPFNEFEDWPLGMAVNWPNLAILRDEAKKLLAEGGA